MTRIIPLTLYLLVLINFNTFAQIPYATEQPAWYMTLYAEDASGTRDSVFIGYDPEATNAINTNLDARFGETWLTPDNPNEFRMATYYSGGHAADSAKKVNIRPADVLYGFEILLDSALWPVTFTWDVRLLRSDSLPFTPADTSAPNAQMRFGYGGFNAVQYADNNECFYSSVLITDTVTASICNTRDSLILGDFFMNPYRKSSSISIEIMPWNGVDLLDIFETEKTTFSLSPNPVQDRLTISLNKIPEQLSQFLIYHSHGSLVKTWPCNQSLSQTFSLTDLNAGLYIAKLQNKHGELLYSTRFIKH